MLLDEIKENALKEHIPIIMDDTLDEIKKILKEVKPKRILEIGSAVGYSAICFSMACNNNVHIDTIELDEDKANRAIKNISDLGLSNNINVIQGNAVEILPTISDKYDVVFIDANKGKYPFFLNEAIRLTKLGSYILADNILYKGYVMSDYNKHKQRTAVRHLREYIQMATENDKLDTQILNIGDGLAVSIVKCTRI